MLRKLILTTALSAAAISTSFLSFAQGVTWFGLYRANLQTHARKDGDGKERSSTYIASYGEFQLLYKSQAVNGWSGTAQVGFRARKEFDKDGTFPLTRNFFVTLGNESFGVKVGRTKFLGDTASNLGGYIGTNYSVGLVGGTSSTDPQRGMSSLVDDGDLTSRDIGSASVELRGLPVYVAAGVGTQSSDKLFPDGVPTDATAAKKTTQTWNQVGALVRYTAADFSAGVQFLNSTKDQPAYNTAGEKTKNGSEQTTIALAGSYNLASAGVPINLWLAVKLLDSKTKAATVQDGKNLKDGNGGSQMNLGGRYVFLPNSQVGLNYASTTFEKDERLASTANGYNKKATGSNVLAWVNYGTPWGTTVFFTYGTTEYKLDKVKRTFNSTELGLNQTF